ncbi:MAG: hypothetical protein LQ349_001071 [Xanthoria aureola]|nr:MAG: hypothetical protein LQ349_001071 [Xanthoria aureola]
MPRVREDYPYLWHLCFEEIRPETGTDYPCTARQLRDIRHPPMLRYPRPISPHEACDALVDFLSRVPRPGSKTDAALCRIGDALDLLDWGPDLIIKAFHDLDRAFFATTLTGMTTVDWFANHEFQAMGCPPAYGMTTSLYPGPQAIYLNARNIFRTGQAGHFSQMWQTVSISLVPLARETQLTLDPTRCCMK